MKLRTLLPVAFGKFHKKQPIVLEDGLNIIMGDNESGKSTLVAFISGMLYGFKKEGRTRISRTPEFEKYRPWLGNEYRGIMVYEDDGRTYRVERWFDPDIVKIYDEITGEEITGGFMQDSRKEYNFPEVHLGLSGKEFRNTIWIGQLGSAQDGDLGLEIQGKLENILQGGGEDLCFAKALSALNVERGKIKTPRSTRAQLDVVHRQVAELEAELDEAKVREAEVRKVLVALRELIHEEDVFAEKVCQKAREVDAIRTVLLRRVVSHARDLQHEILDVENKLRDTQWARDISGNLEKKSQELARNQEDIDARINESRREIEKLEVKQQDLAAHLEEYEPVVSTGLDEAEVSGLHSRYLACKANAARGERRAMETRRELRKLEEAAKGLGLSRFQGGEDLLAQAEELQNIVVLAEREKSRCDLEVEKARAGLAETNISGASGWLYAISLGILGIAIALTIMGLPMAVPAFGISILVFGIGSYRHRKALQIKSQAQHEFDEKKVEAEEQAARVLDAQGVLQEFLALQGVRSVESLRARVQEISVFNERLMNAKDRYDVAHRYWFESSQEFSEIEKQLVSVLAEAGCLRRGQAVTDGALDLLKVKLKEAAGLTAKIQNLNGRIDEFNIVLARFESKKENLTREEQRLLEVARVRSIDELDRKIAVHKEFEKSKQVLEHLKAKLSAVLSGRHIEDLESELYDLEKSVGSYLDSGSHTLDYDVLSETDYQQAQKQLDEIKSKLSEIRTRIASMEKEVILRQREGRPVYAIQEDLTRVNESQKQLTQDKQALELAIKTLEELSRNLRREFAPILNERVGEILKQITRGRYIDVRISPDLDMSVIHPGDKSQTPISALSGGTIDQCYFALRVAIAELIINKQEFPFFLDDSFVQYDDKRLEGALKIVSELSQRHQILLFSCHGREEEIARKLQIPCNMIRLNGGVEPGEPLHSRLQTQAETASS